MAILRTVRFSAVALAVVVAAACRRSGAPHGTGGGPPNGDVHVIAISDELDPPQAKALREKLVRDLVASGHVRDNRAIAAMRDVPRHLFVPDASLSDAYDNRPFPIGEGQTISQPAVVGMMTQALELSGKERVLEIGTGSGYQAAVLSELCADVFTIELVPSLGAAARDRLARLGYANVQVKIGDGYQGWPEHAPFDRIVITAAPPEIPPALQSQLADGGILVAPIGDTWSLQRLVRVRRTGNFFHEEELGTVIFVPMVPGR
jgi:protein-L-isoaspartate(D-aspartate) O-methyltransferase